MSDKTPTLNIPNSGLMGGEVWVEPGHKVVVTYRYSNPVMAKEAGEQARKMLGNLVSVSDDQSHVPGRVRLHLFLEPQQEFPLFPVPIVAKHSGKVLDVAEASMANGAHFQQWDRHGGDNQQFQLESLGDGHYRLVAKHSGKVLDVAEASMVNGAPLQQWDWHGGDNQQFRLESLGDGHYRLVAKHSGKVVDVAEASMANGGQLHQWDWHGGDNQRWRF